ncbi:MAG: hypothetical protein H5U33_01720, partial [Pseudomonas sp.]|nr:hypothetical protein [Pseudomonas sp.]
ATPLLVAHNNGLFEAEGIKAERPSEMRKRPARPEGDKPAGRGRGKPRG